MSYRVRNWDRFQHYKGRNPPWVKVYRDLLTDPDWGALTGDDARLLVELWLVASQHNGDKPGDLPELRKMAYQLRREESEMAEALWRLRAWIESDEPEPKRPKKRPAKQPKLLDDDADAVTPEQIYDAYPRKAGRKRALTAIRTATKDIPADELLARVVSFSEAVRGANEKFIPHPATWFHQGRWDDPPEEWARVGRDRNEGGGSGHGLAPGQNYQADDLLPMTEA